MRLAQEGADIYATDACEDIASLTYGMASEEDLAETARLVEKTGRRIITRKVDVRDQAGLDAAAADCVAQFGRIDIVSANAGVCGCRPTVELTEDEWQDMIDINLTGVWKTSKAVIPQMLRTGGGSIVLTSSVVTYNGSRNVAHYNASKHGVVGLMQTLAAEYGGQGIRVNAVHPATSAPTCCSANRLRVFCPDLENPTIEDLRERARGRNIMDMAWVEPEDITNAVLWLASEEARYVTGISIPVDCGLRIS